VLSWTVRKHALALIEFLTLHAYPYAHVVLVGALPAAQLTLLTRLFPELNFHIYIDNEVSRAWSQGYSASVLGMSVTVYQQPFDEAQARRFGQGGKHRALLVTATPSLAAELTNVTQGLEV
jgi:hypothetical protein